MKKERFYLFLIFLLAFFLRVYQLGNLPHTFHEDEVLSGYVGSYLIRNGFDLYGNRWPLWYFNKFGDYYIIGPIYLSGLSTLIFGVNEFATRFPHAFFGALAVFPIFTLSMLIFKNKTIALFSSLFLAIVPWHIVLSRSTTEGIIGTTLFLWGLTYLLKSKDGFSYKNLFFAFLFFLSGYWIYHPYRLYPPLVMISFLVIFSKEIKKNKRFFNLSFFLILFFLILSFSISQTFWGKGRLEQTSIFSPISGVVIKLNELIANEGQNNILIARIFHNKIIGYTKEFINQYLSYFSFNYLFVDGWKKSRYFVPEQGLLYLSFLPLIFVALINLQKSQIEKKMLLFLFFILLTSVLPAAFTVVESPNPHRSLFLLIPLLLLISFGFEQSLKIKIGKINLGWGLSIVLIFEIIFFLHQYTKHSDYFSSLVRNDGQKEIADYVIKNENKFDLIFLPAEAAMSWYYLFYKKDFNPLLSKKFKLDARIEKTGKISYIENSCPTTIVDPKDYSNKKILIIDRPTCQSAEDRYQLLTFIYGVNSVLLKYKVFTN
jgi:4-amino-4-deoxy-L-arabinose transferase-like glycosyltransferase